MSEQCDSEAPRVGPAPQHALQGGALDAGLPALCWCQGKISDQVKPKFFYIAKPCPALTDVNTHTPAPWQLLESQALAPSFRPSGPNDRSEFLPAQSLPSLWGRSRSRSLLPTLLCTENEDIRLLITPILRDTTPRAQGQGLPRQRPQLIILWLGFTGNAWLPPESPGTILGRQLPSMLEATDAAAHRAQWLPSPHSPLSLPSTTMLSFQKVERGSAISRKEKLFF